MNIPRTVVVIAAVLGLGGVAQGATTLVTPPVPDFGDAATHCTIYNSGTRVLTELQITFRTVFNETLLPLGAIPNTLAADSALDVSIADAPSGVCKFRFKGGKKKVRAAQCRGEAGGPASCVTAQ